MAQVVFALLVALLRRRLRRILLARRQDFASECERLEEHVAVLARFCPMAVSVEGVPDLA